MLSRFTRPLLLIMLGALTLGGCTSMLSGSSVATQAEAAEHIDDLETRAAQTEFDNVSTRRAQEVLVVAVPDVKAANRTKFERALTLMEAEDYLAAESLLQTVVADQPELAGPWVNLGLSRIARGETAMGEQALNKAIEANPHNCVALNQLGVISRERGEFAQAELHYQKCIAANPYYVDAQLNLGILYELYMGRYAEALAAYQDYQLALQEPNPTVNGWLLDLERRVAALAQR